MKRIWIIGMFILITFVLVLSGCTISTVGEAKGGIKGRASPSPTSSPTASPTSSPTATPTASPTASPTSTPTASPSPETCTDSDATPEYPDGKNYYVKGTVSTKGEEWTDFCWNYDLGNYGSCEGNEGGCVLAEHSCKDYWDDTYGYGWKEKYDCPNGCQDGACIKGACGEIEWQKVIGSGIPDYLRSIIQTLDGGYVVVGRYNSSGYVMKLNNIGDVEWSRPFSGDAYALSVDQTSNGGYVILTNKNNVIKLDSNGNIDWINDMVGGFSGASPKSIEQTSDGGYIFVDGSDTNFHIVKIINATSIEWERIFDTSTTDIGNSIAQTSDG
jgi:hypothetical protein